MRQLGLPSAAWSNDGAGLVGYGRKDTNSSTTTTSDLGLIRIDNIAMKQGHLYAIYTGTIQIAGTVSGDSVILRTRYNASGIATTGTTIGMAADQFAVTGSPVIGLSSIWGAWVAPSDSNMSVLLCLLRRTGTGSVSLDVGTYVAELFVQDMGTPKL